MPILGSDRLGWGQSGPETSSMQLELGYGIDIATNKLASCMEKRKQENRGLNRLRNQMK